MGLRTGMGQAPQAQEIQRKKHKGKTNVEENIFKKKLGIGREVL